MTDPRRDLAIVQANADAEIRALFRPLAPQLAAIIERHATKTTTGTFVLTLAGRVAIMREVDRLLDTVYGSQRGAPSPLESLIVRQANAARSRPVRAAVADIRRRVDDRLAAAMEAG